MQLRTSVFFAALLLAASQAGAQQALEVLPLKYRSAEHVLPALRPLLEPGGTLTGQSTQLIVRASPANVAEIRRALESIDQAPRRLLISVRFDSAGEDSRRVLQARGGVSVNTRDRPAGRGDLELRAGELSARSEEQLEQRIQVIEGGTAFISTGESRPLPQRQVIRTPGGTMVQDTTVVQDIATGFEVTPRMSGGGVHLDIAPRRETPCPRPGSVEGHHAATSVYAPLGEWVELAANVAHAGREERGVLSRDRTRASATRRIWVRVEEIRH
jgi:type II secretory pathway component GspD/PulD (secretin)